MSEEAEKLQIMIYEGDIRLNELDEQISIMFERRAAIKSTREAHMKKLSEIKGEPKKQ